MSDRKPIIFPGGIVPISRPSVTPSRIVFPDQGRTTGGRVIGGRTDGGRPILRPILPIQSREAVRPPPPTIQSRPHIQPIVQPIIQSRPPTQSRQPIRFPSRSGSRVQLPSTSRPLPSIQPRQPIRFPSRAGSRIQPRMQIRPSPRQMNIPEESTRISRLKQLQIIKNYNPKSVRLDKWISSITINRKIRQTINREEEPLPKTVMGIRQSMVVLGHSSTSLKNFNRILPYVSYDLLRQFFKEHSPILEAQMDNDEMLTLYWYDTWLTKDENKYSIILRSENVLYSELLNASVDEIETAVRANGISIPNNVFRTKADWLVSLYYNVRLPSNLGTDLTQAKEYVTLPEFLPLKYIYWLRIAFYGLMGETDYLPLPPHRYVSSMSPNPQWDLIRELPDFPTFNNLEIVGLQTGILFTPINVASFLKILPSYSQIQTRPENLPPPGPFEGEGETAERQYRAQLIRYTDQELLEYFRIPYDEVISRVNLIYVAIRRASNGVKWSFLHGNCSNAKKPNIITLDPREEEDNDPVISYGVDPIYRCYNISELIGSFRTYTTSEGDRVFRFQDPDWIATGNADREFPFDMILQLKIFLETAIQRRRVPDKWVEPMNQLLAKIREGSRAHIQSMADIDTLTENYQQLSDREKEAFRRYLGWMFITAMYGRYWKGPGNPWPIKWVDDGEAEGYCTIIERESFLANRFIEYRDFMELFQTTYPKLKKMAELIPIIETGFANYRGIIIDEGTKISAQKLDEITALAMKGAYCVSHLSNLYLSTAVYLATHVIGMSLPNDASPSGVKLDENRFTKMINNEYLQPGPRKYKVKIAQFVPSWHYDPDQRRQLRAGQIDI